MNFRCHRFSCCAQLTARRLWYADGTVHAAFHGLSAFLLRRSIAVVCIQETHAPAFAALPNDQPYRCDGPCDSGGSEAGFLFHETVTATSILGLPNTKRIRWRLMSGRICVSCFYPPHGGVASVRHTQQTLPATPIVLCGDAIVRLPEFRLNRERQRDHFVFPYVSELLDGCGLSLRNSFTRVTHVAGAALDLVFCSGGVSAGRFTVHQGDDCCLMSQSCCPALGSDHFLCDFQLSIMDHQEAHGTHVDGVHGARSNFPRVQN